jgi:hypothetical protein
MMKHKIRKTRNIAVGLAMTVAVSAVGTAQAVKYEFHGDLDHRFIVHTDQSRFPTNASIVDGSQNERVGNFKYRLWTTAATDDGSTKGVFAIEAGSVRFGRAGGAGAGLGGAFSGDGVNVETRWAYVDTDVGGPGRLKIGLQPYSLNKHLWKETAAGILLDGAFGAGDTKYTFAWMRGSESFNNDRSVSDDLDALSAKFNFSPSDRVKLGVFGLFQTSSRKAAGTTINCSPTGSRKGARCYEVKNFAIGGADLSLTSVGVDGTYTKPTDSGNFFVNWDVIAQTGSIDGTTFTGTDGTSPAFRDFDVSGQMARFEVGARRGKTTYKYTFLFQSGDDDPTDDDFEAFLATDMDATDSVIFGEESITSDIFLVETNYLFDKGIFQNRFDVGHQINKKLWVGGAISLLALAEDVEYVNGAGTRFKEDALGVEVSGRLKYKFATRTLFEAQLAFLSADDAMDFFEGGVGEPPQDGDADEDIVKLNARVRYKF